MSKKNNSALDETQFEEDLRRAIEESKRGESESDWTYVFNVPTKKRGTKGSQAVALGDVHHLLSMFKTSPCRNKDPHDHRKCVGYHSEKDKRRNPYAVYYLPDDEDLKSSMEYMYHPIVYLTKSCGKPNSCPFGRYCAKAHDRSTIRNTAVAKKEYSAHWTNRTALKKSQQNKSLGAYVQTAPTHQVVASSGSKMWNKSVEHNLPKCSEYLFELDRDSKPWFLIKSKPFFSFFQEVAMKEGLAQIEIRNDHWGEGEYGIAIRGNKQARDSVLGLIASHMIEPPIEYFVQETKPFSSRVINKLCEKSKTEIYETILGKYADRAFIEFSDDEITICAINHPRNAGKQIIFSVFEKLSFWVQQEGRNKFIDCCICMDSYNLDEGVKCIDGHFYCGGENGCIGGMVKEQLERMHHQDDKIICSMCEKAVDTQSLAPFLSVDIWSKLEETIIDSKVKVRVEKLNHEFDRRLEEKIQAFMNEYGSADSQLKLRAKRLAKQAQDDILNLKCPHCKQPYAEFAGCMAIQCGT